MTQAAKIVAGLGGAKNIVDLESCITRLRVDVADPTAVDAPALEAAGAYGVVVVGSAVQVVMGPQAEQIADEINAL